jgi:hypothetical protein
MAIKGFSRIRSSTFDPDKIKDSYENVLSFKMVRCTRAKLRQKA